MKPPWSVERLHAAKLTGGPLFMGGHTVVMAHWKSINGTGESPGNMSTPAESWNDDRSAERDRIDQQTVTDYMGFIRFYQGCTQDLFRCPRFFCTSLSRLLFNLFSCVFSWWFHLRTWQSKLGPWGHWGPAEFSEDIVQFSSDIYYCSEDEGSVRVEAGLFSGSNLEGWIAMVFII